MGRLGLALGQGVAAGLFAGIPQVLLTQLQARLLDLPGSTADIGPRFVQRLAQHADESLPRPQKWLLAGAFHFGYATWWGVFYALVQVWRPSTPLVGASSLAGLIYTLAFSPWGAATHAGSEQPPERRSTRLTLLHLTAAFSFSFVLAYTFDWLRGNETVRRTLRVVTDQV